MGEEDTKHVLERVADVLARIGGDPRGARPRPGTGGSGSPRSSAPTTESSDPSTAVETRRAVTDGGANGAPPGDVPWAGDDPIVFGDDADADRGSALHDAVTDPDGDAAPPFGDVEAPEAGQPEAGDGTTDGVDAERLDELDARLDALEGDHVQLESRLADVARGVASIQEELSTTGEDVRLLVATLGGIAIAREGSGGSPDDATDLAATLDGVDADELGAALGALSGRTQSGDEADGSDGDSSDRDGDPATESVRDGDAEFDEETTPEGIHRGVGDPPSPHTADEPDAPNERLPSEDVPADGDTPATVDADAPTIADEAAERTTDGPARELVDPRTDAVGARLRQFREGFVDDPTADLPTGNSADEFRFDKVLLPTDGEAAPDLSNAELEKPYLETLPDGYAVDAVVLEWLDWLVSAADGEVAAQAVRYYESIDWLTGQVRDDLLGYLGGLGETTPHQGSAEHVEADRGEQNEEANAEPPAALDLQDHLRSLQYVTELASGEVGSDGI